MAIEKVQIGDATLYCADCREVLPLLPRFDLVLTDPPYGVLDVEWDAMSPRELARFTMFWASHAAAQADTMITFFGEKTRRTVAPILEMLYPEVRQLIWNKTGGAVAENTMFYAFESAWLCHQGETLEVCEPKTMAVAAMITAAREQAGISKGGVDMLVRGKKTGLCYRWEEAACLPTPEQTEVLRRHLPLSDDFDAALDDAYANKERVAIKQRIADATATDVLTYPPPTQKQHPCEKPVPLLARLAGAVPNALSVADYFMGSGTTGVACAQLGKAFTGIERERKYFDIACQRIERAYAQGQLIPHEAPKKPEQMGVFDAS